MLNRESEYLISMIVGFDFMQATLHRMIDRYPDYEVFKLTLVENKPCRDNLVNRLERARLMNPVLQEVIGENVSTDGKTGDD